MKIARIAALCLVVLGSSCFAQKDGKIELKTRIDSISYMLGTNIGKSLRMQKIDIALPVFSAAIKSAQNDEAPLMTEEQMQTLYMSFQAEMQTKQAETQKVEGEKNAKEGEKFLAENKSKPGVVTLPSGLQYKILKEGTGPKPAATDKVRVHYSGTLISGKEFDSSYKRGEPAEFPVTGVIKGWVEALQLMPVGSKWMLYIPWDLAYGDGGAGGDIGPKSTLIFEVELLEIVKDAAAPTGK